MLVAGVDSSTQATKVLLCEAGDGTIAGRGSAPHPGGTECPPEAWWAALQQAGEGLLNRAAAVGVAGQQHGMVVLDDDGAVIRPALLWNDLRSAAAASALVAEHGGPRWWAEHTGNVPNASFTVAKLRWLAEHEPDNAARTATVMLPHDWLTLRLGAAAPVPHRQADDSTHPVLDLTGTGTPGALERSDHSERRSLAAGIVARRREHRPLTTAEWPDLTKIKFLTTGCKVATPCAYLI